MGFLLREVEIREEAAVLPCLSLISLSICIRHCSGDRVGT